MPLRWAAEFFGMSRIRHYFHVDIYIDASFHAACAADDSIFVDCFAFTYTANAHFRACFAAAHFGKLFLIG